MNVVIGVGSRERADDGAGLLVAERVRAANLEGVTVIDAPDDLTRLLEAWGPDDNVIIVDAVSSGAAGRTAPNTPTTHSIALDDVIALARQTGRLPARLTVMGVPGTDFRLGQPMSAAAVEAAGEMATKLIVLLRVASG